MQRKLGIRAWKLFSTALEAPIDISLVYSVNGLRLWSLSLFHSLTWTNIHPAIFSYNDTSGDPWIPWQGAAVWLEAVFALLTTRCHYLTGPVSGLVRRGAEIPRSYGRYIDLGAGSGALSRAVTL